MKTNTSTHSIEDDKMAAIGIGAMIVFIALILVAAVAAAVIIQTAEKLQQNAQKSGDDTADDMSGKLMISFVTVGETSTDYEVFARLSPGSDSTPAVDISYQLFCGGTPVEGALAATDVRPMDNRGGTTTTLETNTGYVLFIDGGTCDAATVGSGNTAQLYLHVDGGGTTFETLSIEGTDSGEKVV